mgnify:FL=1
MKLLSRLKTALYRVISKLRPKDPVYYINGPMNLPEPLTDEQEKQALKAYEQGDSSARDTLITHNLRLVVYISRKFDAPGANIEDLISIGTIGLIKAVNTFRTDKNIKLATYASRCIENEILMFMRKSSQYKNDVSIDEPLNVDWDGNELLLSDVLGSDPDLVNRDIEREDERNIVMKLVESLPERERRIMQMRFGFCGYGEHTQKQVAAALGISQSYISRLEKKILERLKKDYERAVF